MIYALIGCGEKVDNSSPMSVAKYYYSQHANGNLKNAYAVIADTCKATVTFDEYVNYINTYHGGTKKVGQVWFTNFVAQSPILKHLEYRRFEVQRTMVDYDKKDTSIQIIYCTLMNEAGNWRVIWTDNLYSIAETLQRQGEIRKADEYFDKVLEYDPYCAPVLIHKGWSNYFEFSAHWKGEYDVVKSAEFNPRLPENQILLAYKHCAAGKLGEANECFQLALELQEKVGFNGVDGLLVKSKAPRFQSRAYEFSSRILLEELKDDYSDAFSWFYFFGWKIDNWMANRKISVDDGINLKRELPELLAYHNQKRVFAVLAKCELERYVKQPQRHPYRDFLLFDAQEHIKLALEIDVDNDDYLRLLERIEQHIKSIEKK